MCKFNSLKDARNLGDFYGEHPADFLVKLTSEEPYRTRIIKHLTGVFSYKPFTTISLDKSYKVIKVTGYGDIFEVTIINDLGLEETFSEWMFEDYKE